MSASRADAYYRMYSDTAFRCCTLALLRMETHKKLYYIIQYNHNIEELTLTTIINIYLYIYI